MMRKTGKLPGGRTIDAVLPCETFEPHVVEHDGAPYLMVHAQGLSTGVIRQTSVGEASDRVTITIWSTSPSGGPLGLALTFTPDDVMLDAHIESLTRMRDKQRAAAVAQAEAAFAKARGR